jgi:hypothetical protein
VVEDVEVYSGTQVIDVGDKEIFLALRKKLVEKAGVINGFVQITVSRRIPKPNRLA